mmetsp:Transcript_34362/g.88855  ORF Transcript_34362/g.88855 Transcript_34362/m.88855 type:complete len:869 (-) Transcript_34362:1065-3671(-)
MPARRSSRLAKSLRFFILAIPIVSVAGWMYMLQHAHDNSDHAQGSVKVFSSRPPDCKMRILVVAADGSARFEDGVSGDGIWLASITKVLLRMDGAKVDLMSPFSLPPPATLQALKDEIRGRPVGKQKDEEEYKRNRARMLMLPLDSDNFFLLDPLRKTPCPFFRKMPVSFPQKAHMAGNKNFRYLNALGMKEVVKTLDETVHYDWILIRDQPQREYAETLLSDPSLAKKMWVFGLDRPLDLSPKFISSKNAWRAVLSPIHFENGVYNPDVHGKKMKTLWLPPILPSSLTVAKGERALPPPRTSAVNHRVCSIGSFPPPGHDYLITEMVEGFQLVRKRVVDAELLLILTRYEERVDDTLRSLISSTAGVTLLPSIPHDEALRYYREECDIGVRGYRDDERQVLSTKVIEMASTGMPVIINPSKIHELVFGSDYKGLWSYTNVNAAESFADVVSSLLLDSEVFHIASRQVLSGMGPYTADNIAGNLYRALPSGSCSSSISRTLRSPIAIHCPSVHLLFGCLTLREAFDSSFGYASRVFLDVGTSSSLSAKEMTVRVKSLLESLRVPASAVSVANSVAEDVPTIRASVFLLFSPLIPSSLNVAKACRNRSIPIAVFGSGWGLGTRGEDRSNGTISSAEWIDNAASFRLVRDVMEVKPLTESGMDKAVFFVGSVWPDVRKSFADFFLQAAVPASDITLIVFGHSEFIWATVEELLKETSVCARDDLSIRVLSMDRRKREKKIEKGCAANVLRCKGGDIACVPLHVLSANVIATDDVEVLEMAAGMGKGAIYIGHDTQQRRIAKELAVKNADAFGKRAMYLFDGGKRDIREQGFLEGTAKRVVSVIHDVRCNGAKKRSWEEKTSLFDSSAEII